MKTVKMTMSSALLKFLDNQYVNFDGQENKFIRGIFGIFGHGNVTGIGCALAQSETSLKFYQGHNEQGMSHCAIAFAKQKNRREIFACTSSIGPGATNMITAAATATVNRIPVLFLPGDVFASRQPDPVLQQIEHPMDFGITANDAFKPVCKYWDRIYRPEQIMTALIQAMRVLTDPAETGAVALCLPQDVQAMSYDYPISFFDKRIHYIERKIPTSNSLDRAINLIQSAKKPLIISGGGVIYSEAENELKEFCEKFNIPFAETQSGKGVLPWSHPLNLGGIGVTGTQCANHIAKEADLIIGLGTRYSDFTTASKSQFENPNAKFLTININSLDTAKLDATFIQADVRETLKALISKLSETTYKTSYTDEISANKNIWTNEVNRLYSTNNDLGLSQTRTLGELNSLLPENSIIVGASGSLPGCLQRLWRPETPKSYHMEYGYSCMGYEIAGALGAKLANPDREVYSMCGDGSFLMMHSELLTSIREGQKINILLFDNSGFQCIKSLQTSQGIDSFGNEFRYRNPKSDLLDGDYIPVDYAKIAEGLGAKAFTVNTIAELQKALKSAAESTKSTLIHIKVLPGTHSGGYDSWWRVGIPETSNNPKIQFAYLEMTKNTDKVRKY